MLRKTYILGFFQITLLQLVIWPIKGQSDLKHVMRRLIKFGNGQSRKIAGCQLHMWLGSKMSKLTKSPESLMRILNGLWTQKFSKFCVVNLVGQTSIFLRPG